MAHYVTDFHGDSLWRIMLQTFTVTLYGALCYRLSVALYYRLYVPDSHHRSKAIFRFLSVRLNHAAAGGCKRDRGTLSTEDVHTIQTPFQTRRRCHIAPEPPSDDRSTPARKTKLSAKLPPNNRAAVGPPRHTAAADRRRRAPRQAAAS